MQEVLVARWTLVKTDDGEKVKTMSKDEVECLYPEFAAEVRQQSAKLVAGTKVSYYWQNADALEKDRGGFVAWRKI